MFVTVVTLHTFSFIFLVREARARGGGGVGRGAMGQVPHAGGGASLNDRSKGLATTIRLCH